MIIGLQGYAGAGKSEVAKYLVERHGFSRRHIKHTLAKMTAELLKDALPEGSNVADWLDGPHKREPIPELGNRSATEIQQFLGTEFGREFVDSDLWVSLWSKWALAQSGHVVQESVRFANEAERCDVIWEIRRPGFEAHNGHVSEGLPARPHMVIVNHGSVELLHRQVDLLLEDLGA